MMKNRIPMFRLVNLMVLLLLEEQFFDENGNILGSKTSHFYLENLVPTDEIAFTKNSVINKVNIDQDQVINGIEKEAVFKYTPQNKLLVFAFNKKDLKDLHINSIEISNSKTNEIIARAHNIDISKKYKLVEDFKDIVLDVKVNYSTSEKSSFNLIFNSSNDKRAENKIINTVPLTRGYVTTGTVPKNIDGNQGQFMASYLMNLSRYFHTKFMSGTNGMSSLNIAHFEGSICWDFAMNVPVNGQLVTGTHGSGSTVRVKLSTNSTSGQATLYLFEWY